MRTGDVSLPIPGGKWLTELSVGKHILNYDAMLVLTHFKGHTVGGFGGSLKTFPSAAPQGNWASNRSISCRATGPGREARSWNGWWKAAKPLPIILGNILPISTCSGTCPWIATAGLGAAAPTTPDLGIIASTDILAVDQASVDMVYVLPEAQRRDLVERIESRSACANSST